MSKPFSAEKSNRTPMTDRCKLVSYAAVPDADGYDASRTPSKREIFCGFAEGVSRAEYYEAMKAGVRLSATVEIWEEDYQNERELEFGSRRFQIGRVWQTGRGTLQLYLTEVWR
jgi:hypothetical protein